MATPPESADGHWEPAWIYVPNGTHLSDSRATPGANRNILRDDATNRLKGPTESIPMDDFGNPQKAHYQPHNDPPLAAIVVNAAVTAAVPVIINALIYNIDWTSIAHRAHTGAKGAASSLRRHAHHARKRVRRRHRAEQACHQPGSNLAEIDQPKTTISGDEYQAIVQSIVVAEAFANWQRQYLTQVTIDETKLRPGLGTAVKLFLGGRTSELSPHQIHLLDEFFSKKPVSTSQLLPNPTHHDPPKPCDL